MPDNGIRSNWWNSTNVKIVSMPKPSVPSIRQLATQTMLRTAKQRKGFTIPTNKITSVNFLYEVARQHGYVLRTQRNGATVKLWAERPKTTKSSGKGK